MNELISRTEAVKAALAVYHQTRDEQHGCLDIGYNMVYDGAAEIALAMVQLLMEIPGVYQPVVRYPPAPFAPRRRDLSAAE